MDQDSLIPVFKSLERNLPKFEPLVSQIHLVIHYHLFEISINQIYLPVNVLVQIFPLNHLDTQGIDFYYLLADRLTSLFNYYAIGDIEFVYPNQPAPLQNELRPLTERVFQLLEKPTPIDPEIAFLFEVDY